MLVDSHSHINFPDLAARLPEIFANMAHNQVECTLCVSVNLPNLPQILALAQKYPQVYASVGVHPDEEDTPEPTVEQLIELAQPAKVVAIGETGLDYFRLKRVQASDLEWQRARFRTHIRASRSTAKPLIIHTRNAAEDTLTILREEGAAINAGGVAGVMHCFTESQDVADAALAMGFYISFSGIVTFKSARELQAVAQQVPLEKMLIETDSPYLAPVPHRGKVNEPAFVKHVAEFIADLKGISIEEVARQTTQNFYDLFKVERSQK